MRKITCQIAGLLLVCLFGGSVQASADKPFSVVVGFSPPVSDFCRAILTEAFSRLGREVRVQHVPAERAIRLANDGIEDAECLRIKGIERLYPNLVQVPEPLFEVRFTAFVRKGFALQPGWKGLKPFDVGALYGWKLIEIKVKEVAPKSFVRVDQADSLFRMLQLGRIDVAALNTLDGELKLRELGIDGIEATQPPLAQVPLFLSLHKRHQNLIEPLARVFREMQTDGTWAAIERRILPAVGG